MSIHEKVRDIFENIEDSLEASGKLMRDFDWGQWLSLPHTKEILNHITIKQIIAQRELSGGVFSSEDFIKEVSRIQGYSDALSDLIDYFSELKNKHKEGME